VVREWDLSAVQEFSPKFFGPVQQFREQAPVRPVFVFLLKSVIESSRKIASFPC
jgi:hypothetical protein